MISFSPAGIYPGPLNLPFRLKSHVLLHTTFLWHNSRRPRVGPGLAAHANVLYLRLKVSGPIRVGFWLLFNYMISIGTDPMVEVVVFLWKCLFLVVWTSHGLVTNFSQDILWKIALPDPQNEIWLLPELINTTGGTVCRKMGFISVSNC